MSAQSGQEQESEISFGAWEEALPGPGDDLHDGGGEPALEQFDEGIDLAGGFGEDPFPARLGEWLDLDADLIEVGSLHEGLDFARRDLEINDGAVSHVGAAARQAILVIAIGFEVVAPGLAPERGRDLSSGG
jgi:hypothetical protein